MLPAEDFRIKITVAICRHSLRIRLTTDLYALLRGEGDALRGEGARDKEQAWSAVGRTSAATMESVSMMDWRWVNTDTEG